MICPADHLDREVGINAFDHLAEELQGVVGVAGCAEADVHLTHQRFRARPVRDVPLHQAGRGEDVDEDVLRAAFHSEVAVVVHVLEVTGRERRADHERGRGLHVPLGQGITGPHGASSSASSGRRRPW